MCIRDSENTSQAILKTFLSDIFVLAIKGDFRFGDMNEVLSPVWPAGVLTWITLWSAAIDGPTRVSSDAADSIAVIEELDQHSQTTSACCLKQREQKDAMATRIPG